MRKVAKLIDTSVCIGCKACEVACQQWNDQPFTLGAFHNSYQTLPDLAPNFWNLILFHETNVDGAPLWLMAKYQCMHCSQAGCIEACPAPGAIVQLANGIVDFVSENCIGCGYCISGCPFDVPRLDPVTRKVTKCSLCSDRVAAGLTPACIKACPTSCLTFGARDDLLMMAHQRAEELRAQGWTQAGVYDGPGVGGTHVLYVLKYADAPERYGLPKDPKIPWSIRLWKGPIKWLGNLIFAGGLAAALAHYIRYGPKQHHEPEERSESH